MAKKQKKKTKYRAFWIAVRIQIALMLLIMLGVAYYYGGGYAKKIDALHEEARLIVAQSNEQTFKANQTSLVYDANGKLISTVKAEKDVYYVTYDKIPADFIDAMISVEDKKFWTHKGYDLKAIIRAAVSVIRKREITQGGSTITQQLARTMFLSNERTWQRKVEEIFIARELEEKYGKEKILEFYFNNIYFANGYYGIEAASQGYFSRHCDELSLSEVTFLCAIPNSPTNNDPVNNIANTYKRRDKILRNMLSDNVISESRYNEAKAESISLKRTTHTKIDYVETFTYYCATRELMKLRGFEFRYKFSSKEEQEVYDAAYKQLYEDCQATLFTAGYRIYTSIDLEKQDQLQKAIDTNLAQYGETDEDGRYLLQSAGVCIDNNTGRVVAIVGGRTQEHVGYTLNRAYQSYRQPGSSIKPLIVYTPSFERGLTPDSIVEDKKIENAPKQNSYLGEMTIRTAVEKSRNSVAWQLFAELSPKVGLEYLINMNFNKIVRDDYYLPASLGGFTYGASPLEMASAYAAVENDGFYRIPTCIIKITDADGNPIVVTEQEEKAVYDRNAARMMISCMEGVLTVGTAKGKAIPNMPCAGKTGTTNDNKDGWFVGFSYYYTTSIWVGYDTPKKLDKLQGGTFPATIWNQFMTAIHEGLSPVDFLKYIGQEEEPPAEEPPEDEEEEEDIEPLDEDEIEDDEETN
ncbi:MAG: transglycosylase domain-containing protein [Lachnospiraceae bacterium]|nr:transglycosylase domain-containing protein [Lachnospiraceae bacterium]